MRASWSFFADWQSNGIALCQEIANNILPPDAPLRQSWVRAAASIGYTNPHPLYHYYNGGLAGVPREYSDFLTTWKDVIELAGSKYCDLGKFNQRNPETPFNSCDQDCLNVAAMYSKFPLSTLGPQAMGFIRGHAVMFHTVGPKPWNGSFLLSALKGTPPSDGAKFYLTQVSYPIRPYSRGALAAKSARLQNRSVHRALLSQRLNAPGCRRPACRLLAVEASRTIAGSALGTKDS